jgi:hypothetical protein
MERIDPEIADLIMPGEEMLLVASQSKNVPGGAISKPNRIYITNTRVLFKDPRLFGLRARIIDLKYEDIATVMLRRGIFSTEIYLKPRFSPQKIELPAVDKKVALHASLLIQRGMRGELHGSRSAPRTKTAAQAEVASTKSDPLNRLEKLAGMRERGTISDQEFQVLKEELMLSLKPEVSKERVPPQMRQDEAAEPASMEEFVAEGGQGQRASNICKYCNFAPLPPAAKFCPECGKGLQEEGNIWKMCPICDALMASDAVFCAACKQRFPETLS